MFAFLHAMQTFAHLRTSDDIYANSYLSESTFAFTPGFDMLWSELNFCFRSFIATEGGGCFVDVSHMMW